MVMAVAVEEQGRKPRPVWGRVSAAAREDLHAVGQIRVPEFLLGALTPMGKAFQLSGSLTFEALLVAAVVLAVAFVRPSLRNKYVPFYALMWVFLLPYLVAVSVHAGQPWTQRSARLFGFVVLSVAIAGGRIRWRSVVAGLCFSAIFLNTASQFVGLGNAGYEGFLTGFLGDKNVTGMVYALCGVLLLSVLTRRWVQVVVVAVDVALLYLTGSRTSLAAFAAGLAWVLLRNRVGFLMRMVAVGIGIAVLRYTENNFAEVGVYADRQGTDWFRSMIDAATQVKVAASPWYGSGLNTAWVYVYGDRRMWFHDSYAALRVEGGYPLLISFVGLMVLVVWGLFDRKPKLSLEERALSAGAVVLLVCAWKLGEVFFTIYTFTVIGARLAQRCEVRDDDQNLGVAPSLPSSQLKPPALQPERKVMR